MGLDLILACYYFGFVYFIFFEIGVGCWGYRYGYWHTIVVNHVFGILNAYYYYNNIFYLWWCNLFSIYFVYMEVVLQYYVWTVILGKSLLFSV